MNKDYFERSIGEKLRGAKAEVPVGAWNLIQAKLQVQAAPSPMGSFGFGAAIIVGGLLLAGLATHSAIDSSKSSTPTAYTAALAPEKKVQNIELQARVNTEVEPSSISEAVNTISLEDSHLKPDDGVSASETVQNELAKPSAEGDVASVEKHVSTAALNETNPQPSMIEPKSQSRDITTSAPIVTSGTPDNIVADEEEPFSAAIRTSGSFGYAPFRVEFENRGTATGQVWDFGSYGKSSEKNPVVVFDKPGLYSVMLSAFRGEDEQKIEFVTIEVEEGSSLFVPNSFTPDGDGQNEVFQAKGSKLSSYMLTIVNSKGAVVFQTLDIDEPWRFDHAEHGHDGEFYIAVVRAQGLDGEVYSIRHRINIIY